MIQALYMKCPLTKSVFFPYPYCSLIIASEDLTRKERIMSKFLKILKEKTLPKGMSAREKQQEAVETFNKYLLFMRMEKATSLESLNIELGGQDFRGKIGIYGDNTLALTLPDQAADLINEMNSALPQIYQLRFNLNDPKTPIELSPKTSFDYIGQYELDLASLEVSRHLKSRKLSRQQLEDLYWEIYDLYELYAYPLSPANKTIQQAIKNYLKEF